MVKRSKPVLLVYLIGMLVFLSLIVWSFLINNLAFVPEMFLFMFLITIFLALYDKLNLTLPIFIILILTFIPHVFGFLGYYANSPVPIFEWDNITHFFPFLAFSLFFFQFLYKHMNHEKIDFNTFFLIIVSAFAALGIGTLVELFEFFGFLLFGVGEGGLAFGTGDAFPRQIVKSIDDVINYGGGWFNTMYDLIWNSVGVFLGTFIMVFYYYVLKKTTSEKLNK